MTLESLELRSFQCHRHELVELDPHVTVFVGPSDSGKSAFLRALKLVSLNRPSGESFIRHGSKRGARVRLVVDGHTVVRIRGRGRNVFFLDGRKYVSFGTGKVPDDIVKILNIGEEAFASQHDAPFWLSLSPAEVSRRLNSVVDLSLIDRTLAAAAAEVRKSQVEREVSKQRLKEAKRKRQELDWVKECNAQLEQVELLYNEVLRIREERSRIASAVRDGKKAARMLADASEAILCVSRVVRAGEEAAEIREERQKLSNLLLNLRKAREESCRLRENATRAAAEAERLLGKTCPLCGRSGSRVENGKKKA